MKIIFQSIIGSVIIYLVYFFSMLLVGYIKTKNYTPLVTKEWENVEYLQNEVAFGYVVSPMYLLFRFVGVTVFCGVIIVVYKKWRNKRKLGNKDLNQKKKRL